jgi:hypothetical protein
MVRKPFLIAYAFFYVAAMGYFHRLGRGTEDAPAPEPPPDHDLALLQTLRNAGDDLSKPHELEFFLYFPREAAARKAAEQLKKEGYRTQVEIDPDRREWACAAERTMVPTGYRWSASAGGWSAWRASGTAGTTAGGATSCRWLNGRVRHEAGPS